MIIALDIIIMIVQYLIFYYLQICLKALVYSIKLKLAFAVLGRLVKDYEDEEVEASGEGGALGVYWAFLCCLISKIRLGRGRGRFLLLVLRRTAQA
jgi:hypothetical protein